VTISILVTLPPAYPASVHVPQLQLLNRYIGSFGADSNLFGRVLRTYFSIPPPDGEGVPFTQGEPALWEGLEHCRSICQVRVKVQGYRPSMGDADPSRPTLALAGMVHERADLAVCSRGLAAQEDLNDGRRRG
jgi:hypothetical protein